jgi:hypothetical protein
MFKVKSLVSSLPRHLTRDINSKLIEPCIVDLIHCPQFTNISFDPGCIIYFINKFKDNRIFFHFMISIIGVRDNVVQGVLIPTKFLHKVFPNTTLEECFHRINHCGSLHNTKSEEDLLRYIRFIQAYETSYKASCDVSFVFNKSISLESAITLV